MFCDVQKFWTGVRFSTSTWSSDTGVPPFCSGCVSSPSAFADVAGESRSGVSRGAAGSVVSLRVRAQNERAEMHNIIDRNQKKICAGKFSSRYTGVTVPFSVLHSTFPTPCPKATTHGNRALSPWPTKKVRMYCGG